MVKTSSRLEKLGQGQRFDVHFQGVLVPLQNLYRNQKSIIISSNVYSEGLSWFDLEWMYFLSVPEVAQYIQMCARGIRFCRSRTIKNSRKMTVTMYIIDEPEVAECEMNRYMKLKSELIKIKGKYSPLDNMRRLSLDYHVLDDLHKDVVIGKDGQADDFITRMSKTPTLENQLFFGVKEYEDLRVCFEIIFLKMF